MNSAKIDDIPNLRFERSENGVYFTESRPTAYTVGVLIELVRSAEFWTGTFMTFHASPQSRRKSNDQRNTCDVPSAYSVSTSPASPTKDMVSAKISLHSRDFKELIGGMRNVFDTVPKDQQEFTNEERAAIEIATELQWRFPKKIIAEMETHR